MGRFGRGLLWVTFPIAGAWASGRAGARKDMRSAMSGVEDRLDALLAEDDPGFVPLPKEQVEAFRRVRRAQRKDVWAALAIRGIEKAPADWIALRLIAYKGRDVAGAVDQVAQWQAAGVPLNDQVERSDPRIPAR